MGFEASGTVLALGPEVMGGSSPAVGDEMITHMVRGGYASEIVVPVGDAFAKPETLDFAQAANLMLVGTTTAQLLVTTRVAAGETALVHGASGATGLSVLQQAVLVGARVIGTAGAGSFEVVRRFGGEPVAYGPGLEERVRAAAPDGVAVSLDCVGTRGATKTALALVADRTRVMTIAASHAPGGGLAVSGGERETMAYRAGQRQRLIDMAATGRLTVPIARTHPLAEAAAALSFVAQGHPGGKVALLP